MSEKNTHPGSSKYTSFDGWHNAETSKWDDHAAQILKEKRASAPVSGNFGQPMRTREASHTSDPSPSTDSDTSKPAIGSALFEQYEVSDKPLEIISPDQAYSLLAYVDVLGDNDAEASLNSVRNSDSGKKYANELILASQEIGSVKLLELADGIHETYTEKMYDLGLPSSKWGESRSWILWDIAKQRYLLKHPEESSREYTKSVNWDVGGGDPLILDTGNNVVEEIIHRHIGWEYSISPDKNLLKLPEYEKEGAEKWVLQGERNSTNQLRSFELTNLGYYLIRKLELARSRERAAK